MAEQRTKLNGEQRKCRILIKWETFLEIYILIEFY